MNKKFSTLLAAFLVAGGLGSSAFADQYRVNKYVQLQINGQPLVVGESAVRDSLAYGNQVNPDLYEFNQTLWQFVVEAKTGANGLADGYNVYLQNKVNGGVILTKADADEDKSLYYAPGAVLSTGKLLVATGNVVTGSGSSREVNVNGISFTNASLTDKAFYDAASKSFSYYYLDASGSAIKLMVETKTLDDIIRENPTGTFGSDNKITTEAELKRARTLFETTCASLGATIDIVELNENEFTLGIDGLNKIANDAFDLTFTEDISANAKFANPFTASSLHASTYKAYTVASYDTNVSGNSYDEALKAANKVVSDLKQLKTDAASYVKEIKVAIDDAENAQGEGLIESFAPNATDIAAVKPSATSGSTGNQGLLALLPTSEAYDAINGTNGLTKVVSSIVYVYDSEEKTYNLKDATNSESVNSKDIVDALDKALADVNTKLDKVINEVETAVAAYSEAVNNSMTSYQLKNNPDFYSNWVNFENFAAFDKNDPDAKNADGLLTAAEGKVAGNAKNALQALDADKITVTTSLPILRADQVVPSNYPAAAALLKGYYPIEVVGEPDTYITVDTIYAAEQEKYLTLNTVKMDKIAVHANGIPLTEDEEFKAGGTDGDIETVYDNDTYVLVPTKGHNLTPALFMVEVDPYTVGKDIIKIKANAPKPLNNDDVEAAKVKWFNQYKDITAGQNVEFYNNGLQVVIRTLAGAREASVQVSASEEDVLKNTTITFAEPVLASKINDGDIYFIINKNVRDKADYGKYAVVDPIVLAIENEYSYAKEAYVNVPGTQWYVEKNNDTYELKNRDYDKSYKVGTGKIYVVDEENMLYTTTARDTFQLVAANAEKEGHVGYKYISEEIQKISEFALSAINYANMETPYYLAFDGNEDSVLTTTSNKEEALALIPMIKDGKQVTEEYKMNDENLSKQFYQLIAKDGKDTLYLNISSSNELIVTKEVPSEDNPAYYLQFRSINDEPNAYEVLLATYDEDYDQNGGYNASKKLSYNQDGEAVVIDENTAAAFVYDLVDNSSDIYKNFGFEGSTKVIISLNGDAESKVTKIGPFATVKRTGLDETIDADYSLIMDTAYVDHKDNIRYAYYITKPIVAADTAWNAEKFYMVSYADSVAAKRDNDTIKYSQDNLTRIGFVAAKRLGTDSLAITKAVGATATDTLNVTDKLGVTNATFAFAIDENNDEAYRIEVAPTKYVSYLNGILVEGAKEQAQLFNVNATDLTPTDNEEISVEAGVQVIGGKGAVTVQGAAGKTVTVYNFQGRALASTTLTSDNQTIAVPAGLVAVSVEGEPEAISVVVK